MDAGGFTTGSWVLVTLNTEVADTGGNGTLAANQVTLAAGTYRTRWSVPAYQVNRFQTRLYNATGAAVIAYGSNADADAGGNDQPSSYGEYRFTIAAATAVQLEARCETSNAGDGFGRANSFGGTEIYASIVFEKEG